MEIKSWRNGLKEELNFWHAWLAKKGKLYEGENRLSDLFTPLIGDKKEVRIANLGAGPLCLIGNRRRDVKVDVVSSDFLADEYRQLLRELNIKPLYPVEKQDMTSLNYKNNSFDVVFCANALDHCPNPYKALEEMVRVCKTEGFIYLRHIAHEGKRHNYRGLHQWNIDMTEDGDSIFWNNDTGLKTETFYLSEIYPGFKTSLKSIPRGAFVTSIVQKT